MTKDKSRFCLILGDWCYKECPHYYYRDSNKCYRKPRTGAKRSGNKDDMKGDKNVGR